MSDQKSTASQGAPVGTEGDGAPLVKMVGIDKWFGKVCALRNINFHVGYGEIVGLVGDNGAGKSTLIKVLSGFHLADKGEIYFEGNKIHFSSPKDAKKLGIETVYQEQALAPHVSIARNVFMGREPTKGLGFMNRRMMDEESMGALTRLGLQIKDPEAVVEALSGGQRQGVAIARVLYFKAKLVILDEPTIALSVKESQQVLDFTQQLRAQGISVIFITHNIFHVFQVATRFFMLSHGEMLIDVKKQDTDIDHLIELIVSGRKEQK
jgi:simple sugar transport system ATP-binding protein